jgi:hypothetical protein
MPPIFRTRLPAVFGPQEGSEAFLDVDLVSVAPPVARRAAQVRRGSLNVRFWLYGDQAVPV